MLLASTYSNPVGVQVHDQTAILYNRTGDAVVAGSVYMLDLGLSATESTTNTGTGPETGFGSLVAVTSAGADTLPLCVVIDGAAGNAKVKVGLVGIFDVSVAGTNATAIGESLHAAAATALNSDASSGARAVGVALEVTASGTAEVIKVLFDGCGMGVK